MLTETSKYGEDSGNAFDEDVYIALHVSATAVWLGANERATFLS